MYDLKVLAEFKKQLVIFFDELIDFFPFEGDLVVARVYFSSDQLPMVNVMNSFIHHIHKNDEQLKQMIKERNDLFFLEHSMFDTLGKDKICHFKKIWRSKDITDEFKQSLWRWADAFVYLGDVYMNYLKQKDLEKNK